MRNFLKRLKSSKVLVIGMVVTLCFAFTGCSKKGEDSQTRGFTDFTDIKEESIDYFGKSGVSRGNGTPEKIGRRR